MLSHLSYSSLGMMMRCGEQFRRRYMLGQIIPPAVAMGMGRGLHKASELNLSQKIFTGRDLPKEEMVEIAHDEFIDTFKDGVFLAPEETDQKDKLLGKGLDDTVRLTELHRDQAAPMIHPVSTELKFKIDLEESEIQIMGFIDCVEEGDLITDLKATKRSWNQQKVDSDLQSVFYTIAHKHINPDAKPRFRYLVHVALKTPKLQELTRQVQERDEASLFERIRAAVQMLRKGAFMPADPGSWQCSPRWCGYYQTCRYVGNGEQKNWV